MKSENVGPLSLTAYARLRKRSVGWVNKLLRAGLPHEGGGRTGKAVLIPLGEAIQWEIDRSRQEQARTDESARERLAREQGDRIALENAVRRGQLCERADVEAVVIGAVQTFRTERNGIAGRLANELVGLTAAQIRGRIVDELRRCDQQFASRVGTFTGELEHLPASEVN